MLKHFGAYVKKRVTLQRFWEKLLKKLLLKTPRMKKIFILFNLLLTAMLAVANDNLDFTNNWGNSVTLTVKQSGQAAAGIAALSDWDRQTLREAYTLTLLGSVTEADMDTIVAAAPALTLIDAEGLTSVVPDNARATGLVVPKGTALSPGRYAQAAYVLSRSKTNDRDLTVLLNRDGAFAAYVSRDPKMMQWQQPTVHLIGTLGAADIKALSTNSFPIFDLSQTSGLLVQSMLSQGDWGNHSFIILPDNTTFPSEKILRRFSSSWDWSVCRIVIKSGSQIAIYTHNLSWATCPTLSFADSYLEGVTSYVDKNSSLSDADKAYLKAKGITEGEAVQPFDGTLVLVDLSGKTLEEALNEQFANSGLDPKVTLRRLYVRAGSLEGQDLSAYTALESIMLPTEDARPATLPASMKYIAYQNIGIELIQPGSMKQAVDEVVELLKLKYLKIKGTVSAADLHLDDLKFNMNNLSNIDLSEATGVDLKELRWSVIWGNEPPHVNILAPNGTTNLASYVSTNWGMRNMTGTLFVADGEDGYAHVVNLFEVDNSKIVPNGKLHITVEGNNVMQTINVIQRLQYLDVPEIDLQGIIFPNATPLIVENKYLKRGVDLGTQTIFGNYTLSAANEAFTTYTLKATICGNLDLSGSVYLTSVNLAKATIDGTITLPNPEKMVVTIAEGDSEMRQKVVAAGVPDDNIHIVEEPVSGKAIERGNYIVIRIDIAEDDFPNVLDQAIQTYGTSKSYVIQVAGNGFDYPNLLKIKEKQAADDKFQVYFDLYDIDTTSESNAAAAVAGLKSFLQMIDNRDFKKPLGILMPQNISDSELTVDQVATRCVEFAGRARAIDDTHIVSLMFVNKGADDNEEIRNDQTRQHFNAGADIAMFHSDLRQKSMMYLVGTDDSNFVNTDDRIPLESRVTLLKVQRYDGNSNGEVTVYRSGELGKIISLASRMVEQEAVNNLVVKTATYPEMVKLNAADIAALNAYTRLKGINLFNAEIEEGLSLNAATLPNLERLGVTTGSIDYSSLEPQLKTLVEYDLRGDKNIVRVKVSEAGQCENAFLLVEPTQRTALEYLTIQGTLNNADLKYFGRLPKAWLIDLSDCSLAPGTELRNIITGNKEYNDQVAYILPTPATTTDSKTGVTDFQYDGDWNRLLTFARYDDNTKKRLSIWTYPGKLNMRHYSAVVNEETTISFMPKFQSNGTFADYPYMNWSVNDGSKNPISLWDELAYLKCGAVDFTWVNISQLGYDFSKLNSTVKHIIIPTNATNKEGNEEYAGFNDEKAYTYPATLETVSTFKNVVAPFSNNCKYSGGVFTCDRPTLISYIRTAGSFAGVRSCLNSSTQRTPRLNLIGTINASDVAELKNYTAATQVDLHLATLVSGLDLTESITGNEVVQQLALPDNDTLLSASDYKNCNYKTACKNLKVVGSYNTTTNTYTAWTAEPGQMRPLTLMIHPTTNEQRMEKNTTFCDGLQHIVLAGRLNMDDIQVSAGGGLDNACIQTADLSKAVFPTQTDMVFTGHGGDNVENAHWGAAVESVKLPTDVSMTTLPDYMLGNVKKMTYICIPGNYKHIGAYAFYDNDPLVTVTTTELDDNGNGTGRELCYNADATLEEGDIATMTVAERPHTITLPANLESVKHRAFSLDEHFTDVFLLGTGKAPTCEAFSFGEGTLVGWGGFNNVSPITRESYVNGDGESAKVFAILHWPAGLSKEIVKCYTDTTRQYSIYDELQNIDGDGHVLVWPNQTEYLHAFITGTYGYLWDAYDKTLSAGMSGYQTTAEQVSAANPSDEEKFKFNTAYAGWHQFVLTGSVDYNPTVTPDATEYREMDYYTICLPFDLTYKQLMEIFGAPAGAKVQTLKNGEITASGTGYEPLVSTLYRVTRNYDTRQITLHFAENLMTKAHETGLCWWNTDTEDYDQAEKGTDGSPIVMRAGYPYLIVPVVPKDIYETAAKDIRAYAKLQFEARGYEIGTGDEAKVPYQDWRVWAYKKSGKTEEHETYGENGKYTYLFLGTYDPMGRIPDYSYFMAYNSKKSYNTWYRNVWGDAYKGQWNGNSALIGANPQLNTNETEIPVQAKSAKKSAMMDVSTRTSYLFNFIPQEDPFVINGQVQRASYLMAFDDTSNEQTTGISTLDGEPETLNADNCIYTLDGRKVTAGNHDLSPDGLAKGIYIINGKKVVIR